MHYDLSWNPTRHEQREGRVDRFGQSREVVKALTYYGVDNQIDGIVLEVLIRKSKAIRQTLGVSVPVPENTDSVMEAVFEGLLLREHRGGIAERLPGFEEYFRPKQEELHRNWDVAAHRERRSRTVFAQETLKPDEVARELSETQAAVGSGADVKRFFLQALQEYGASVEDNGIAKVDLEPAPLTLRHALGADKTKFLARFQLPVDEGQLYLTRTSPLVERLGGHVLDTALDPHIEGIARRCGAIRSNAVTRRTTLLLLRLRFGLVTGRRNGEKVQLAEDARLLAFEGAPEEANWLDPTDAEALLGAEPTGIVGETEATELVAKVLDRMDLLLPRMEAEAFRRADELLSSHERVRSAARLTGVETVVEPKLPADVLGIYVFLPQPKA
jgi:hypothetical protein